MQCESPERYCRKAFKAICKDHRDFAASYDQVVRLVTSYIEKPQEVDKPADLELLYECDDYQFWKVTKVMVRGLRRSQWPRMWIGISLRPPPTFVPLVIDVHKTGYKDNAHESDARAYLENYMQCLAEAREAETTEVTH